MEGARHGERSGYNHDGCRASGCRKANSLYHRSLSARKREQAEKDPSIIPHGTPHGYSFYGCRCELCVDSNNEKTIRLREGKRVDQEGRQAGV